MFFLLSESNMREFCVVTKKIWRVFSWKPRHLNELAKRFKRQKFQNIILSVADSGVIEKITLKSVIIYESGLFRPI